MESTDLYEVSAIVGRRVEEGNVKYLVRWQGFSDPTWEPATNLSTCRSLLQRYDASHPFEEVVERAAPPSSKTGDGAKKLGKKQPSRVSSPGPASGSFHSSSPAGIAATADEHKSAVRRTTHGMPLRQPATRRSRPSDAAGQVAPAPAVSAPNATTVKLRGAETRSSAAASDERTSTPVTGEKRIRRATQAYTPLTETEERLMREQERESRLKKQRLMEEAETQVAVGGEEEFEITRISGKKREKDGTLYYRCEWAPVDGVEFEPTYEPASEVNAPELIEEFEGRIKRGRRHPQAAATSGHQVAPPGAADTTAVPSTVRRATSSPTPLNDGPTFDAPPASVGFISEEEQDESIRLEPQAQLISNVGSVGTIREDEDA